MKTVKIAKHCSNSRLENGNKFPRTTGDSMYVKRKKDRQHLRRIRKGTLFTQKDALLGPMVDGDEQI